jgi:serine/threonine protein phosphatase 1
MLRIIETMGDLIQFAIGDIHGEAAKLDALHAAILERIAFEKRAARIVHLGDYVDRGPDSRGVIERVMDLQARFRDEPDVEIVALLGNHEQMMFDAWAAGPGADDESWMSQGGAETVASYGHDPDSGRDWRDLVPKAHLRWIASLPDMLHDPERKLAFVHAGIEPSVFPLCSDRVHLWTRSNRFLDTGDWPSRPELDGLLVVHGHTPQGFEPEMAGRRINVDTGACFGGPLTAVMLSPGRTPQFLRAF